MIISKVDNYFKQTEILTNYFKEGEFKEDNYRIGAEIEHLILHKENLEAVSFYEKGGVEDILNSLLITGNWKPVYEGNNLIGLTGKEAIITIEPGGQFEFSINPCSSISDIDLIYNKFLKEIIPLLERDNKYLAAIGYQPVSLAKDIPLIPKKRYKYMYDYFKNRGKYAHNMMKGTASIHVSLDYSNEDDYIKKYTIANFLTPYIYSIFSNSPFFEQEIYADRDVRAMIWWNCDENRCGTVSVKNGYDSYAEYLLNTPPIIVREDGGFKYTGNKLLKEIFDPDNYSLSDIEHFLSMVFPDVRTKNYLELRMGDTLPYPYCLGYIALWKGLLYNKENLDILYTMVEANSKPERNILAEKIYELAGNGLNEDKEQEYLTSIEIFLTGGLSPGEITLNNLDSGKGQALKWCFLNYVLD